uniref:Uncharacterized protein n=1 Tax=Anguilla anguilla TaxID=7936 RepID=A0A0E9PN41_ANGAN
MSRKAPKPLSP